MNDIEKLSLEDIIKKVGFFANFGDLMATYKFNSPVYDVQDFEYKMNEQITTSQSFEEYLKIIKEYEHIFDKNIYVFRAVRLLQDTYNKITDPKFKEEKIIAPLFLYDGKDSTGINTTDTLKRLLRKARKMIIDADLDIVDYDSDRKTGEVKIYESRELIGKNFNIAKDNKKSQERLRKIDEEIGLEKIIGFITPTDLIDICKYPNLGNLFAVQLIESGKKMNKMKNPIVQDRVNDKEYEPSAEIQTKGKFFDWDEFEHTVRENIRFIDIDKMLLLATCVSYNRYKNELEKFSVEEARELREFTRKVETLLENKDVSISSQRFSNEVDFNLIKSSVESLNKHYINGRYYDDIEINDLVKQILFGERSVTFLSEEEYRQTMAFKPNELLQMVISRPESLKELDERGWISDEELNAILSGLKNITNDQLLYLFNNQKISNETIISSYLGNKISLETIKFLRENADEKEKVEKIVSTKGLVELYLDEEKQEEFIKYRALYQALKIYGKDLGEKKEIANEILEESDELLSEDKMQELYHMGLIPLDTYIDFIGVSAVSELYSKGDLKPLDARRLYEDKILTEDMIIEVLKDGNIENGQKLILIYSTFPENEDLKIRNNLIKFIKTPKKSAHNKGEKAKDTSEGALETGKTKIKYSTDPCARWNLLSSLDSDYSLEYKSDGSAICYLPNRGKYIIEKLYDKQNAPAYGTATYILDEETYLNNKEKIVQNDVINITELGNLNKALSSVKRLIHTGWANAICRYFDIEDTSKYTEEQIKQIKKFSKQVEESRKPIER